MWFPPPLIRLPSSATTEPLNVAPREFTNVAFWCIVAALVGFWVLAYGLAIQRARVDKYVGIPALAVAGNFAWEFVHSLVIDQNIQQRPFNLVWLLVDVFILTQVFRYGNKDFPRMSRGAFRTLIIGTLLYAAAVMLAMTYEFRDVLGLYDGVILCTGLSASFIVTLRQRKSSAGQSMYIAISKWLGSFFAGLNTLIVYPHRSLLLLLFATVFVLDVTYIALLYRQIRAEGGSPWALNRPRVIVSEDRDPGESRTPGRVREPQPHLAATTEAD